MPNATPGALVAFAEAPAPALAPRGPARVAHLLRHDRAALAAAVALGLIAVVAILAPWIAPFDPDRVLDLAARAQPPSAAHWFGTDPGSRDLLSRVIHGARVSLGLSTAAVLLATLVGTAWGAVAGYAGGALDAGLMRIVDAGLAIPRIILLLGVVALWGSLSVAGLAIVLGLTGWFGASRLVRDTVRATRTRDFVVAARAAGASPARVLVRHVLPHALTPMLVAATLGIGQVVVLESGLAFLGYGIAPPLASWGGLLRDGREVLATAWWATVFPGLALAITVLSINVLGDRLRAALGAGQLPVP